MQDLLASWSRKVCEGFLEISVNFWCSSKLFQLIQNKSCDLHKNRGLERCSHMGKPHETGNFELRGHHGSVGQPTISLEGDKFRKGCLYVLIGWASGLVVSPASCLWVLTLLLFLFLVELSHVEGFVNILQESQVMHIMIMYSNNNCLFFLKQCQ